MSTKNNVSISGKTTQLSKLVEWFDSEDFELEQALDKFTAAEKLAAEIENDLMMVKNKITVLSKKFYKTE